MVRLSGTGPAESPEREVEVRVQYEITYNDGSLPNQTNEQLATLNAGEFVKIIATGGMTTLYIHVMLCGEVDAVFVYRRWRTWRLVIAAVYAI